jgi:hypothetical protein
LGELLLVERSTQGRFAPLLVLLDVEGFLSLLRCVSYLDASLAGSLSYVAQLALEALLCDGLLYATLDVLLVLVLSLRPVALVFGDDILELVLQVQALVLDLKGVLERLLACVLVGLQAASQVVLVLLERVGLDPLDVFEGSFCVALAVPQRSIFVLLPTLRSSILGVLYAFESLFAYLLLGLDLSFDTCQTFLVGVGLVVLLALEGILSVFGLLLESVLAVLSVALVGVVLSLASLFPRLVLILELLFEGCPTNLLVFLDCLC